MRSAIMCRYRFPDHDGSRTRTASGGYSRAMGAPNVVRGGSHSGNTAVDLAREGLLDIMSSDYVPSSLLMAAMQLPKHAPVIDLASAVRTVTKTAAEAVGLTDRGEIVAASAPT